MTVTYKSDFLNVLSERGFIHQMTDTAALDAALCKGPVTGYCGLEPTATSLHVGHLFPIMLMRWFQRTGNKPIMLVGGATAKIGDPSFKDETRKLLSEETIAKNIEGILKNYRQFIDFGTGKARLVNNADWLDKLNYIEFLRDVGVHYSVNRMLAMDSVRIRLEREQNMSFIEFNYMLMQGYDFVKLHDDYGCTLQMSGSDQWGNVVSGIELGRRMKGQELFGLTTPLLTNADGSKMGKTAGGAIWVSADHLPPYDYYQFWRNTADADVAQRLAVFTELPMDEVKKLSALKGSEINEAKKILAFEATKLCHGEAVAHAAAETARQTFEEGTTEGLERVVAFVGDVIVDILVTNSFAESKSKAKSLIKGGGVKINDVVVTDEQRKISEDDFRIAGGTFKLSAGKKRHILIEVHAPKSTIKPMV